VLVVHLSFLPPPNHLGDRVRTHFNQALKSFVSDKLFAGFDSAQPASTLSEVEKSEVEGAKAEGKVFFGNLLGYWLIEPCLLGATA
jgi:hypothetical protein